MKEVKSWALTICLFVLAITEKNIFFIIAAILPVVIGIGYMLIGIVILKSAKNADSVHPSARSKVRVLGIIQFLIGPIIIGLLILIYYLRSPLT